MLLTEAADHRQAALTCLRVLPIRVELSLLARAQTNNRAENWCDDAQVVENGGDDAGFPYPKIRQYVGNMGG